MHTRLALTLAAGALLTVPASSHALAGTLDKQCYTHLVNAGQDPTTQQVTEPITVSLTGGTPGGTFQIAASSPGGPSGGKGSETGTFDANGNGTAQITNVYTTTIEPTRGQKLNITATDFTAQIKDQAIGSARVTNLTASVSSRPRNPRKKRAIRVSGNVFAGQPVYGFVTTKNRKRVLDRFRLGTGNACGFVKRKAVVAPSPFRFGTFGFSLVPGKKFSREAGINSTFSITRRTF